MFYKTKTFQYCLLISLAVCENFTNNKCWGFSVHCYLPRYNLDFATTIKTSRRQSSSSNNDEDSNNSKQEKDSVTNNASDEDLFRQNFFPSSPSTDDEDKNNSWGKELERLNVENVKQKLEESHRQSFLKAKPWKLPYPEASKWVQRNLDADTKEEFEDLVANGNVRTPYIPKCPEKYYKERGTWISWEQYIHTIVSHGSLLHSNSAFQHDVTLNFTAE